MYVFGARWHPYIVFRNRFLYRFMIVYMYVCMYHIIMELGRIFVHTNLRK